MAVGVFGLMTSREMQRGAKKIETPRRVGFDNIHLRLLEGSLFIFGLRFGVGKV